MKKSANKVLSTIHRHFYLMAGGIMLLCGFVGAFLPIMPTVPFIIAAAWCFSRSSPAFNRWLHDHAVFGPPLECWEKHGAISIAAKIMAVGGMAAGFAVFCFLARPPVWLAAVVVCVLLCSAAFVLSRHSR